MYLALGVFQTDGVVKSVRVEVADFKVQGHEERLANGELQRKQKQDEVRNEPRHVEKQIHTFLRWSPMQLAAYLS